VLIGSTLDIVPPQREVGATLWTAAITVSGNNFEVTVTGGLAATIDWMVWVIGLGQFTP
jgi:hypothetical protein